ncbi:MAG: hypothetical protein AB1646_06995 [Thermodesulfobacteriota bacterium]
MLFKILSSNWVAIPVFIAAMCAVGYLYFRGRVFEAKVAGIVLLVAAALALFGSRPYRGSKDEKDAHRTPSRPPK